MGKPEDEHSFSVSTIVVETQSVQTPETTPRCCKFRQLVSFRCVFALLLGLALLVSALFWLPPFYNHHRDQGDPDPDSRFRDYDIVASFKVEKSVDVLKDNVLRLEDDIFGEIDIATTKVVILSLEPSDWSNTTKVVFAVDSDSRNARISLPAESLIRANFEYLVIHQSLRLTESLFGIPYSFEVLKFRGGITVIPPQSAFLLQNEQISFNFTLNFPIDQIQDSFQELTSQLRSGLRLASYENLYIRLTNYQGSTVTRPTTVQSSVLLAVGTTPSTTRQKQLAHTITNSHAKNLGLNNTEFGRVKQVHLSSILPLGGDAPSLSPSPTPLPYSHHHHQHHHHHHHHHLAGLAPTVAPVPAPERGSHAPKSSPTPQRSYVAQPPGCRWYKRRYHSKAKRQSPFGPSVAPVPSSEYSAPAPSAHLQVNPPAPSTHATPSSPLPSVVFSHVQPPSESAEPPDKGQSNAPSPLSSSAGCFLTVRWTILLFLALVIHL
ncbi:hypothetical protein RJ641_025600 [Dillenia turbinata]|uniref:DUF7036 domain-containing protein n=1 Tax=Dillenia turbinata TaxID=194707 RepID=A0AAN8W173_9MAGN